MKKYFLGLIILLAIIVRFWNLGGIPVSLFGDELDVGYHAYSILKTGRDYSGNFMPLHFQSLAEWRTPLYLYSAVPTVAIWGISALGVRVPAAIFGVLGVWGIYLLIKILTKKKNLALLSALVLALSPWHIQYSRGGFEVTMLLSFLLFGLYFFFRALKEGKYLWLSASLLVLTPLIYSTAKLFTPFLFVFLFLAFRKEILAISKKYLVWAVVALVVLGTPTAYSTLFGGGGQRFSYISVFSDPVVEPEVGVARLRDAMMRGETGLGLNPTFLDRSIHNKFTMWLDKLSDNYVQSFSTVFLFTEGDPNPRHSVNGIGQFYEFEIVAMLVGLLFFFMKEKDKKIKSLIAFWILAGVLPAAITRDGGNHATRLILILPPLTFLIAYGINSIVTLFPKKLNKLAIIGYALIWASALFFYQHNYRIHYPWDSERWWHAGWDEAIEAVKERQGGYERVFITMRDEPAWIFFAANYEYPPEAWHKGFPMEFAEVEGFGRMSYIDKFYFGSPDEAEGGIYSLNRFLGEGDLYLASAKEVPGNLIMEPERVPDGLILLKSVAYPSGEPAFYLFESSK